MKIEFEIPIEYGFYYVKLEGYPHSQDDSFSHEFGVMRINPRIVLDEDPTWNKKLYTKQENEIISEFISNEYDHIAKTFVNEYIHENLQ